MRSAHALVIRSRVGQAMSEEAIHLDWHRAEAADPIERVARALCRHDNKDPDALVPIGPEDVGIAEDGIAEVRKVDEPAWMEYAKEAERFVVAYRAFQAGLDVVAEGTPEAG